MEDVRKLCGLARSNESSPAASLIACMAIALCQYQQRSLAFDETC